MQWFHVSEHLPIENTFVLGYSEVHRQYYITKFNPARGWVDQTSDPYKVITHWCDIELPLPYDIKDEADTDVAQKYGFKPYSL